MVAAWHGRVISLHVRKQTSRQLAALAQDDQPIALGTELHRAGASVDSLAAFREAAGIARRIGSGELMARAAIGCEDACWRPGLVDQGVISLLEEASAMLAGEESPLRVRAMVAICTDPMAGNYLIAMLLSKQRS